MSVTVEMIVGRRRVMRRVWMALLIAAGLTAPLAVHSVCGDRCVMADVTIHVKVWLH